MILITSIWQNIDIDTNMIMNDTNIVISYLFDRSHIEIFIFSLSNDRCHFYSISFPFSYLIFNYIIGIHTSVSVYLMSPFPLIMKKWVLWMILTMYQQNNIRILSVATIKILQSELRAICSNIIHVGTAMKMQRLNENEKKREKKMKMIGNTPPWRRELESVI